MHLDTARRAHEHRPAVVDDVEPLHWVAGTCYWLAHRRDIYDARAVAVCGAPGDLVLAPPGVPPCRECWPEALSS